MRAPIATKDGLRFVRNQSMGERDSSLTWHNFRCSSKLRSSEFRVFLLSSISMFFIYFNSYGLFSHQLIVCRYVTVVDFYVPIQFYSFLFVFSFWLLAVQIECAFIIFRVLVRILHHFSKAAKRFLRRHSFSLRSVSSFLVLLLLVWLRYLAIHLHSKSSKSSIASMQTRARSH